MKQIAIGATLLGAGLLVGFALNRTRSLPSTPSPTPITVGWDEFTNTKELSPLPKGYVLDTPPLPEGAVLDRPVSLAKQEDIWDRAERRLAEKQLERLRARQEELVEQVRAKQEIKNIAQEHKPDIFDDFEEFAKQQRAKREAENIARAAYAKTITDMESRYPAANSDEAQRWTREYFGSKGYTADNPPSDKATDYVLDWYYKQLHESAAKPKSPPKPLIRVIDCFSCGGDGIKGRLRCQTCGGRGYLSASLAHLARPHRRSVAANRRPRGRIFGFPTTSGKRHNRPDTTTYDPDSTAYQLRRIRRAIDKNTSAQQRIADQAYWQNQRID
ncbi:hypothetical protein LCGC14_0297560 [marine sediment metagenome]|uniref:Uncharacterized protein n=1 Tax=marine sediment metagenome TaxID=412755 RepID=A0A0F9WWZ2_9ZZZZ